MPTRERTLRIVLFGLAILCGMIFVATKIRIVNEWLLADAVKYGDLYPELGVLDFKVELGPHPLPRWTGYPYTTADSAEIFIMGDSFLRTGGDRHPCVDEITLELGQPTLWVRNGDPQRYPLTALRGYGVKPSDKRRVLLLQCVERNIMYFYRHFTVDDATDGTQVVIAEGAFDLRSELRQFRDVWFTGVEQRYQYLLNTSVATSWLVEAVNTFKYREFGMMPQRFPVYSTDPPMVFSFFETDKTSPLSYFYPHSNEDIRVIGKSLADLSRTLNDNWNIELWVVLVPNKLTIYHDLATDVPYDNFIPKVQSELDSSGVKYVNVFDPLVETDKRIFYYTDAHWNQNGIAIAVQTIGETLRKAGTIPQKSS